MDSREGPFLPRPRLSIVPDTTAQKGFLVAPHYFTLASPVSANILACPVGLPPPHPSKVGLIAGLSLLSRPTAWYLLLKCLPSLFHARTFTYEMASAATKVTPSLLLLRGVRFGVTPFRFEFVLTELHRRRSAGVAARGRKPRRVVVVRRSVPAPWLPVVTLRLPGVSSRFFDSPRQLHGFVARLRFVQQDMLLSLRQQSVREEADLLWLSHWWFDVGEVTIESVSVVAEAIWASALSQIEELGTSSSTRVDWLKVRQKCGLELVPRPVAQ